MILFSFAALIFANLGIIYKFLKLSYSLTLKPKLAACPIGISNSL
jgi:hypothetical protein